MFLQQALRWKGLSADKRDAFVTFKRGGLNR
jgi:hypothetical protein